MLPPLLAAALVTCATALGSAHAATVDAPPLDALITAAGLVIEGEVLSVDPGAGTDEGPTTRVVVQVLDLLAGGATSVGARLAIELPEGRLPDGRFVMIAGAPRLAPGQRYLMFLRAGPWFHTPFVGWGYGLLRRVREGRAERWVIEDGRCVAGLVRTGWVLGPRVTGLAPVAPGWIATGEDKARASSGRSIDITRGGCLDADALREDLAERLLELGHAGADRVELRPRVGGWVEAGEAP